MNNTETKHVAYAEYPHRRKASRAQLQRSERRAVKHTLAMARHQSVSKLVHDIQRAHMGMQDEEHAFSALEYGS